MGLQTRRLTGLLSNSLKVSQSDGQAACLVFRWTGLLLDF